MNIDLSLLTGKLLEIAKSADEKSSKPNGVYLDNNQEVSLFLEEAGKAVKNGEISEKDVSAIFGLQKSSRLNKAATKDDEIESVYVNKLSQEEKELVTNKTREKTDSDFLEMSHNLDSMLIENEITGLGAILNRLPQYDLGKLAERYKDLETKFNDVETKVENWYRDPKTDEIKLEEKSLFEDEAEKILGMSYEDYMEKYASELQEVAKVPPIIRGVSSITDILLHEKAVSELSESALVVYKAISKLNTVLSTQFNAWENDIRYKSLDKTSEMSMEISDSMYTVEMNEYTSSEYLSQEFEMPKNWLVKNNFIEAIEDVHGITDRIDKVTKDDEKDVVKKYIKDGKIIIEKENSLGEKEYYDIKGNSLNKGM